MSLVSSNSFFFGGGGVRIDIQANMLLSALMSANDKHKFIISKLLFTNSF